MLLYDRNDLPIAQRLRDARLGWLQELGAAELSAVPNDASGFLFGYQHGAEQYRASVGHRPNIADRPEHREELVRLDHVLQALERARVVLPTPQTWVLGVDEPLPEDIEFPLFVRTPTSSWKRGGGQGKVRNPAE